MPFREPKFIGSRTTIQIVQFPVEDRKRFNLVYDNTTSEFRMYAVDAEAYPSVLIAGPGTPQSTDINTSGFPTLGPIDIIDGPGISWARPAPGQIQATAALSGESEKPWNYHDLHNFPVKDNNRDIFPNNGSPSQRCITKGIDGRIYVIWSDGAHSEDFGDVQHLYLTVYSANTVTGGWDTAIYQLTLAHNEDLGQILKPLNNDFCLCVDSGLAGAEMLHILFISEDNGDPPATNVYDAYVRTSTIGPPRSADITPMELGAELVNQAVDAEYPCSMVAASYQAGLSAGPGIVVVWVQSDDVLGVPAVRSNIYDPTQAAYSRYNTTLTPYTVCVVSDPAAADVKNPSIECTANGCHCVYLYIDDGSGYPLYSSLKSTGVETTAGAWDNVMLIVNGSIDSFSGRPLEDDGGLYTTMVVITDNSPAVAQDVIIMATRGIDDADGDAIMVYTFSADIAVLPAPTLILADQSDVYDYSKPSQDDDDGFQMGITAVTYSSAIPGSVIPEVLIYKVMNTPVEATCVKDFALLHRSYNTLGQELNPFYHVPIECSIGDLVGTGQSPPAGNIRFHPTVHFSNMYMQGGWNIVPGKPWFPYNVYRHLRMGLNINAEVVPADVMIINQKPFYIL